MRERERKRERERERERELLSKYLLRKSPKVKFLSAAHFW